MLFNSGPQPSHWFSVTVLGLGKGGTDYMFHRVEGLERSFQAESLVEGGRNHATRTLWGGPASHGQVTLVSGQVSSADLWSWSRLVDSGTDFKKTVLIRHMALANASILQSYMLVNAWPVDWSASGLDASSGKIAVTELKLAFDDLLVGDNVVSPLEPAKAALTTIEGSPLTFTFPINPDQLTLARAITWNEAAATSTAHPTLTVPGGGLDRLTVGRFVVDGGDAKTSIALTIQQLHSMLLATTIDAQSRPPLASFTWKDLRFVGRIEKFDFDVKLFSSAGDPLRAFVTFSMIGQVLFAGQTQRVNVSADGGE